MPARDLVFRFPASLHYLATLRHLVRAFCVDLLDTAPCEEQVYQLQLAVSELATNIIVHAYRGRELGAVEVRASGGDGAVTLEFWDTGSAFAPNVPTLPDVESLAESGYGSFIIQRCVDTISYDRDGDRNHWRLEKRFDDKGDKHMDLTVTVEDGVAIIAMDGHLDALSAPQAKEAFRAYGAGEYHAVVDLGNVAFIDSSGLASLISGLKTFRAQGKQFRLAAVQPNVRQVLTLTMLDRAFEIMPDVRTAIDSVTGNNAR